MANPRYIVPNFFTSVNFLLGIWSILLSVGIFKDSTNHPALWLGANFIVLCVLTDKLDGFAAKVMKASSEFGAQFDSLADLIAFGLAPAFCTYFAYHQYVPEWYEVHKPVLGVTLSLYVLCAAMRLARYNAIDAESHPDYFVGMPTTLAGAFNSLSIILCIKYGFFNEHNAFLPALMVLQVATAILMVSNLFLPKLKTRKNKSLNLLQLLCVISAYILGIAMVWHEYLLSLVVIYAAIGFSYGLIKKSDILQFEEIAQERDSV